MIFSYMNSYMNSGVPRFQMYKFRMHYIQMLYARCNICIVYAIYAQAAQPTLLMSNSLIKTALI